MRGGLSVDRTRNQRARAELRRPDEHARSRERARYADHCAEATGRRFVGRDLDGDDLVGGEQRERERSLLTLGELGELGHGERHRLEAIVAAISELAFVEALRDREKNAQRADTGREPHRARLALALDGLILDRDDRVLAPDDAARAREARASDQVVAVVGDRSEAFERCVHDRARRLDIEDRDRDRARVRVVHRGGAIAGDGGQRVADALEAHGSVFVGRADQIGAGIDLGAHDRHIARVDDVGNALRHSGIEVVGAAARKRAREHRSAVTSREQESTRKRAHAGQSIIAAPMSRTASLSGFIGRERELERLTALYAAGERVVSIVGAPGVGKSRLATSWARRIALDAFGWRDVVTADLASTRTSEEVALAIGHALRLRDSSPALGRVESLELGERVDSALETAEIELLVLDDADHAIDALGDRLSRWLEIAPRVRFLVTTRQALRLSEEQRVELGPLDEREAIRLVAHRHPELADDPWLARLARVCDGNPLALELASARLRSLGLRDVVEGLERGLDLLDRGARDASARHSSLRRAIDASWDAAAEDERTLLRRCSVFRGWFDVEAATEVAAFDAVDALHMARERSLLAMQTALGRSRYSLSAPIGAFLAEKLVGDERRETEARHARWLARRAREASERWTIEESEEDLAFLREHQGDLAAALAVGEVAADLLLAFDPLLAQREAPAEHAALLAKHLDGARDRPRLELALAFALERAGDLGKGLEHLARARTEARGTLLAEIDVATAQLRQASGDLDGAARALSDAIGHAAGTTAIRARRGLGQLAHARGDLLEAERRYREALALAEEIPILSARLYCDLGSIRLQQHRLDEARELFDRALETSSADPVTVGLTEGNLGILAQEQGRRDDAAQCFARALSALARSGHRLYEAHLTLYLGFLEHERGDAPRAVEHYERALRWLAKIGDRRMAGLALAGLGAAEAERGRTERAREVLTEAEAHIASVGDEGLALALELHRAHVDLTEGDPERRERVLGLLRDASPEILGRSDDARIAMRLLAARLGAQTVSIAKDGGLVRMPDGTEIDLGRRDVLKRIVSILASARVERPNEPVPVDALIEQAWPGERMKYDSALNRLKVALSTLRKLGLSDLIARRDDGYLLDPSVVVAWSD